MWKSLFPSTPKARGKRRHDWSTISRSAGFESLEGRILPAADLIVSFIEYPSITGSLSVANQYTFKSAVTIKNVGDTTADLSGTPFNLNDNVRVKAVFSSDNAYDPSDDGKLAGTAVISGELADSVTITLAPNAERIVNMTGTFQAGVGKDFFICIVDSTNVIAESSESNNSSPFNLNYSFYSPHIKRLNDSQGMSVLPGKTTVLLPGATVVDVNTTEFELSILEVKMTPVAGRKDIYAFQNTTLNGEALKRKGGFIRLGDKTVASIAGGKKQTTLRIIFEQGADTPVINQILQNLTFKSKKSQLGERSLGVAFIDPDGRGSHGLYTVNVQPN